MSFQSASREWEIECEMEAEELIKNGTPPWRAMIEAERIVSDRRRNKHCHENTLEEVMRKINERCS